MTNVKSTADSPAVCLSALHIDQALLRLNNRTGLALVIDTKDFASDLEFATFTRNGERLEELNLALAIEDVLGVKLGYALDGC